MFCLLACFFACLLLCLLACLFLCLFVCLNQNGVCSTTLSEAGGKRGGEGTTTHVPKLALRLWTLVSISDFVKPDDHRRWLHLSEAVAVLDDPESSAKRKKHRTRPARFFATNINILDTQWGSSMHLQHWAVLGELDVRIDTPSSHWVCRLDCLGIQVDPGSVQLQQVAVGVPRSLLTSSAWSSAANVGRPERGLATCGVWGLLGTTGASCDLELHVQRKDGFSLLPRSIASNVQLV